jgi:hypothetical protein
MERLDHVLHLVAARGCRGDGCKLDVVVLPVLVVDDAHGDEDDAGGGEEEPRCDAAP